MRRTARSTSAGFKVVRRNACLTTLSAASSRSSRESTETTNSSGAIFTEDFIRYLLSILHPAYFTVFAIAFAKFRIAFSTPLESAAFAVSPYELFPVSTSITRTLR